MLPGAKRRRVGNRARQNAQNHWQRDIQQLVQSGGHQATQHNQQGCKAIEAQPCLAQRGKKAWPHLNANAVNEQNQSKFLDEVQGVQIQDDAVLVHKMAHHQAAEQHAANP